MPPLQWHLNRLLFHSIRLIQNYTAIGIRGEKVAILVGDGKPTMPRLQQLQ